MYMVLFSFGTVGNGVQIQIPGGDIAQFAQIKLVMGGDIANESGECEQIFASVVQRDQKARGACSYDIATSLKRLALGALHIVFDIVGAKIVDDIVKGVCLHGHRLFAACRQIGVSVATGIHQKCFAAIPCGKWKRFDVYFSRKALRIFGKLSEVAAIGLQCQHL